MTRLRMTLGARELSLTTALGILLVVGVVPGEIVGTVARTVYTGGGLLDIEVGRQFLKVRSLDKVLPGQQVTLKVRVLPTCVRGQHPQEGTLADAPAAYDAPWPPPGAVRSGATVG